LDKLTPRYLALAAALGTLAGWTYVHRFPDHSGPELVLRHPFFGEYVFPRETPPTSTGPF
jgi:hypothetical protein